MILGRPAKGKPKKWDLLLAQAEAILESERCPQCGQPRYICHSQDNDIDFYIYDDVCEASRKRGKYEERKAKEKGSNRSGVQVGIEPFTYSRTAFADFREPYYVGELEKRARREADRLFRPRDHPPGWKPDENVSPE